MYGIFSPSTPTTLYSNMEWFVRNTALHLVIEWKPWQIGIQQVGGEGNIPSPCRIKTGSQRGLSFKLVRKKFAGNEEDHLGSKFDDENACRSYPWPAILTANNPINRITAATIDRASHGGLHSILRLSGPNIIDVLLLVCQSDTSCSSFLPLRESFQKWALSTP